MRDEDKKANIEAARALIQSANKGALGTIDGKGYPVVTLVALATLEDGGPLLLLSRIAGHTQNILRDPRVSLMIEGVLSETDPMLTERLTLVGRLAALEAARIAPGKARFTARHPGSDPYDTELDFSYFRLEIDHGRFNRGFGTFSRLRGDELIFPAQ